jgi:hypothetical protein
MFDEKEFNGAVAVLDVLGFSNRAQGLSLPDARDRLVGPLLCSAAFSKMSIDRLGRLTEYSPLGVLYFADTLVLYLPVEPGTIHCRPERVLESIIFVCNRMMAHSIWQNIPLRGAIAYGSCLVCHDPLYFLGEPFLEAHSLEKAQEWSGVALCHSSEQYVDESNKVRLVPWEVPLKNGREEKHMVVNWPTAILDMDMPVAVWGSNTEPKPCEKPDWDACFPPGDESAERKRENTLTFYEANRGPWGGEMFGPGQRDAVKNWREIYARSSRGRA